MLLSLVFTDKEIYNKFIILSITRNVLYSVLDV